jgi:colanic acid/amylovoran biosynthesis glycosyltransferase
MTRPVIAYLINQYPKVSHSFIRREILALERQGLEVHRWASRGWDADCPDPADQAEQRRTRYLLAGGAMAMALALVRVAASTPRRFVLAARLAWKCSKGADRPFWVHLAYLAQACIALQWAKAARVSHVHAHFGTNPAEVAMLLAELGGPPFSFTVHGPEEFDKPGALHLQSKIQRSAFTVAISSYGRSQLYRWAAIVDWPKIKVVHCGVDAQFAGQPPQPVSALARLVCVGRLCEQKGQLVLLRAAQLLLRRGVHLELVLAGDGEMRGDIESLIREVGLGERVRITGWVSGEQVLRELQAARALVLPSFAEGLPVVIMEAMALGRPVISTFVAGIPELVQAGENGWLVPAGDVEALADAMQDCLESSTERLDVMGLSGCQRVLQRHDVNVEAAKLAGWFQPPEASADKQP